MKFSFEKIYADFAKPLDGMILQPPFGPYLMLIEKAMSPNPSSSMLPSGVVVLIMAAKGGNEALDAMIAKMLAEHDDEFCVVFAHEGHVKPMEDPTPEQEIELKKRGLRKDPNAFHAAMIRVYHRSGSAMGYCKMDAERRATYGPIQVDEGFLSVNVDADQGYQH